MAKVLPPDFPTGNVIGTFLFLREDGTDAGTRPDTVDVFGKVKFTASVPRLQYTGAGGPALAVPLVFRGRINANGVLEAADGTGVIELPATDSNLLSPKDYTWHVEFDLCEDSTGNKVKIPAFDFQVPEGTDVDLPMAVPVATSPGVITIQGPPGPQGEEGPAGPPGAGVPAGGAALQILRKNTGNTTTEWATLTKAVVGLGNVDNTSDLDKPISTATQTALNGNVTKNELAAAADPNAFILSVRPFLQVNARPEGLLWPQAFSFNPDEQEVYIAYNGGISSVPTLRITVLDFEGAVKSYKDIVTESATSTEGLPWFRNVAGDLCFITRPFTNGVGYAIYNYTTGTMGPQIPITGQYKSDVEGNVFFTCDATTASSGVGRVFMWEWESIKAGAPVLLDTIYLENRNMMEKVQSFGVNKGTIFFNHGASNGEILLSTYTLTGKLLTAVHVDKADFAVALNQVPGTITNVNSYRHEGEGAATLYGKSYTGHITDNNNTTYTFTILEHNEVTGHRLEVSPVPIAYDTGWQDIELASGITPYSALETYRPVQRRTGLQSWVRGAIKGAAASPNNVTVATLSAGFRPSAAINFQQQTGAYTANWQITASGSVILQSTTNPSSTTSSLYHLPVIPFLLG